MTAHDPDHIHARARWIAKNAANVLVRSWEASRFFQLATGSFLLTALHHPYLLDQLSKPVRPDRQSTMAESSVPLMLPPSQSTPKRKRDDLLTEQRALGTVSTPSLLTRTMFSFEAPQLSSEREGSNSPRSRVAHQFRDLVLADGGGGAAAAAAPVLHLPSATSSTRNDSDSGGTRHGNDLRQLKNPPVIFDFEGASSSDSGSIGTSSCTRPQQPMELDDDQDPVLRKRVKLPDMEPETSDPATGGGASDKAGGPVHVDLNGRLSLDAGIDPYILKTAKAAEVGSLQKSYPSINRLGVAKSRAHRSTSTPPLGASRRSKTVVEAVEEDEVIVVDPVRADLTWHENEITVYDAEDKDDDGTGLNGIGFKPTAAVAHARAQKRRQQLQEYKKREESDARARRNQRRREQLGEKPGPVRRAHSLLRVHFSDPESDAVVTT